MTTKLATAVKKDLIPMLNHKIIEKFKKILTQKHNSCEDWPAFLEKNEISLWPTVNKIPVGIEVAQLLNPEKKTNAIYWISKEVIEKTLVLGFL